jgi:hypothetical protein
VFIEECGELIFNFDSEEEKQTTYSKLLLIPFSQVRISITVSI